MLNTQVLFNKTLDELEARSNKGDEYELLMTTPLLRKLLVDGENSLISQIDKKSKSLRFTVNVREPLHKRLPSVFIPSDLQTYFWSVEDGLDPETANRALGYNLKKLTFDDFLKHFIIYIRGQEITIRDLIKYLSDKEGGVHKQRRTIDKDDVKNILLQAFAEMIGIKNLPAGLNTLRAINRIVIRDLAPFKVT